MRVSPDARPLDVADLPVQAMLQRAVLKHPKLLPPRAHFHAHPNTKPYIYQVSPLLG